MKIRERNHDEGMFKVTSGRLFRVSSIQNRATSIASYAARKPPSTGSITPVTMLAAGDARKTIAPTSSGG